jgi:hypothetical protein
MPTDLALDAFDLDDAAVQRRFDWAVRQGNSLWVWPDTAAEAWQAALGQIEAIARDVLTRGRSSRTLEGRPEDVGVAGYTSGMGPLLGFWLGEGRIRASAGVAAVLRLHLEHNRIRMARMAGHATGIVDALAGRGLEVVVFKGMDTAWSVFPDPATRPLSDIDLLIDEADVPIANETLGGLRFVPGPIGYCPPAQSWRGADAPATPRSLAFAHMDDPWSVDLQTSLRRRYSWGAPVLELDRIRSPAMLEPWRLSPRAATMAAEARLVHLACHAGCGLVSLSLVRLVEIVLAIRAQPRERPIRWDVFVALAERAGALAMTYPALRFAEQLAPGTVAREVLARCEAVAPARVRRVIERLTPSSAQRVLRCSLEERFMWSPSPLRRLVQAVRELHPPGLPVRTLPAIYRARAWRLVRGTLTR